MADEGAETVGKALLKYVFSVHGFPRLILSDRAKGFVSKGLKWVCRHVGVAKIETTGLIPSRGNSPVERFHRSLNAALTMMCNRSRNDWSAQLDAVLFAFRISVNESTGFSPYFLVRMHGRHPRMPLDVMIVGLRKAADGGRRYEYVRSLTSALEKAFAFVREKQDKVLADNLRRQLGLRVGASEQDVENAQRQRGIRREKYSVGDQVSYWTQETATPGEYRPEKLEYRYSGPWSVTKVSEDERFVTIDTCRFGTEVKCNPDRLRRYYSWTHEPFGKEQDETKEEPHGWRRDDEPEVGEMVVVWPVKGRQPFKVGRLIRKEATGKVIVWWFQIGNHTSDMEGTRRPGWVLRREGRVAKKVYCASKPNGNVDPTSEGSKDEISMKDLVCWGFGLTSTEGLPRDVLRELHHDEKPRIDWRLNSE